jgi:ABC-type transporter Mla MlaB component
MVADEAPQPGAFDTHEEAGTTVLALSGRLDTEAAAALWPQLIAAAAKGPTVLDIARLDAVDTTGATLLLTAEGAAAGNSIRGATPAVAPVLDRVRAALADLESWLDAEGL